MFRKSLLIMRTKLLTLITIATLFFSCKEVEDPSPNSKIEGNYKHIFEGNLGWGSENFRLISILKFNSDGTVNGEHFTTKLDSDEVLGYRGYFSGLYSVSKDKVTISYDESYIMGIPDIYYMPKEELIFNQNEGYSIEYYISEDYSQLSSSKGCQPNDNCATIVFVKEE